MLVGSARLAVCNRNGDWIVVRNHSVQAEGKQAEVLVAPIERAVPMALNLPSALNSSCHIRNQERRREHHKAHAVLELVTETYHLMSLHVILVLRVVVTLDGGFETEGLGELRHGTL
jgi:hypothetical protein